MWSIIAIRTIVHYNNYLKLYKALRKMSFNRKSVKMFMEIINESLDKNKKKRIICL